MKISNEKTVVLTKKKSDYAPSEFRQVLKNQNSIINSKNNDNNTISVQKGEKSEADLNQLAKDINKLSEDKNISLVFESDKNTGKNIIKFVDQKNKEVVKQIPSEELLKITEQIDKFLKKNSKDFPPGFLLNERV
jgi:flagellar protein FlaG